MSIIKYDKIDTMCHDACAFQYNYKTFTGSNVIIHNFILHLPITENTGQQIFGSVSNTSLSNNKYELQDLYIIRKKDPNVSLYHNYPDGLDIRGELLLVHINKQNDKKLNVIIPIKISNDAPMNTNSKTMELEKIINLAGNVTEIEVNNFLKTIQSGYYNYETSSSPQSNWIVLDDDIMMLPETMNILNSNTTLDSVSNMPAKRNISTLRYHHEGAKYLENNKVVRCRPVSR
jgi:hypothetical protein